MFKRLLSSLAFMAITAPIASADTLSYPTPYGYHYRHAGSVAPRDARHGHRIYYGVGTDRGTATGGPAGGFTGRN